MGSSTPVTSTGPTAISPTSVAALRKRIETLEQEVRRINANRKPAPLLVHQLSNTLPMSQVKDGQGLVYNEATGQYEPGVAAYASLRGAGETTSPGALAQTGGFTITMEDLGRDPTAFLTIGSADLIGNSGGMELFTNGSGDTQIQLTALGSGYVGPGVPGMSRVVLTSDPSGGTPPQAFIQGAITVLGGIPFGPAGSGQIGFFQSGGSPIQAVTGSRGGNVALGSLLNALVAYGLIINSTTP